MAIADQNKINLSCMVDPGDVQEFVAIGAITPGMLCVIDANGKVKAHATAGSIHRRLVALPNEARGGGIDDAYAIAETVRVWHVPPGALVYMFLINGTSQDVTANLEQLVSNGDGTLKVATGSETDTEVVGTTTQDLDNDPGTAAARISVEMA